MNIDSLLEKKELMTKLRFQSGITDITALTKTMGEFYRDIAKTFKFTNLINETFHNHIVLNTAELKHIKNNINYINNKISSLKATINGLSNPIHYHQGFYDTNSFEDDMNFYRNSLPSITALNCKSTFDAYEKAITLPYLQRKNTLIDDSGRALAQLCIKKHLSDKIPSNSSLNNVLDTSKENYWSESVFSDQPIKVNKTALALENYELTYGAICELEINYDKETIINEIVLTPFSEYPFEVLKISYTLSDDPNEELKELVYKDNKEETLRNKILFDTLVYKFKDIRVKKVYILINQINYTKNAAAPKLLQYSYGFSNISINYNQFDESGIYVSKPIELPHNIENLSIYTDEIHPELENGKVLTDIEYYLTYEENPIYTDWLPILPINKDIILCELLKVDEENKNILLLRFEADEIYEVSIDGVPMNRESDYELLLSDNGGQVSGIYIHEFDAAKKYTVNYSPSKASKTICLEDKNIDFLRLKAIIRRNSSKYDFITPKLNKIDYLITKYNA
ncbi:hypothetical protein [Clostridium felsineum]|uniref:Uncharacterized protein n=1 Tax=Clostridium felsineum TaxID=36839 RepID=A0A1S8MF09_9CLOT|nr:hypothetical protein [Clostridium felsineum]URZ09223.1 hypothetical protein CLROS_046390 [Clostridium felsineum]URZ13909.1 hypothetical protein CROST_046870 [Clostridium felsineum]